MGAAVAGGLLIEASAPIWGTVVIVGGLGWTAYSVVHHVTEILHTGVELLNNGNQNLQRGIDGGALNINGADLFGGAGSLSEDSRDGSSTVL